MCVYIYIYVYKGCLNKYISAATWPPQTKIPGSAPVNNVMLYSIKIALM